MSDTMTFSNPVLAGMYPDPSWIWDETRGEVFLVNSSFELVPGLPIHASSDLAHWRLVSHAVDETMANRLLLGFMEDSGGVYAPTLRHIGGKYVIACTVARLNRDAAAKAGVPQAVLDEIQAAQGNFIITADTVEGPWEGPYWIAGAEGIDPDVFEDIDGTVWWTQTRPAPHPQWEGQTEIWTQRIDPETWRLEESSDSHGDYGKTVIWHGYGIEAVWAEGPHLYRIGDYLYLMTAEGGTSFDHSEMMMRVHAPEGFASALHAFRDDANGGAAVWADAGRDDERSAVGEYHRLFHPDKKNPFLTHRHLGLSESVQCVGHADLLHHPEFGWWLTCLGVRQTAGADERELLSYFGRETFVAPVEWRHDPANWKLSAGGDPSAGRDASDPGWPVLANGTGRLPQTVEIPGSCPSPTEDDRAEEVHVVPSAISETLTIGKAPGKRFVRVNDYDYTAMCRGSRDADSSLMLFQDSRNHVLIHVENGMLHCETLSAGVSTATSYKMSKDAAWIGVRLYGNMVSCLTASEDSGSEFGFACPSLPLRVGQGLPHNATVLTSFDARFLSTEWSGGFVGCLAGV
ncbi:glycoside hydrolase family 43 protein [Bifidobacterium eulemuris]|uniref:Alpha-L-arabinofuranosidase n=1 Tax=Bifidobacterium eulemuris TaxID=1765219 RepID=A0A261GB35_9BIFI|nr:glycoside hydrolase family 43 protein [Bifidobacterium eulemuris]OZG68642.1 alpha-L-arabinofuranosidase [Bifidobacterium eulemuris]QOL32758.1 glycoside hydrolase family 43 protein [Bifidobacterium eulemuris]